MVKGKAPIVVDVRVRHATTTGRGIRVSALPQAGGRALVVVVGIGGIMVYLTPEQALALGEGLAHAIHFRFEPVPQANV